METPYESLNTRLLREEARQLGLKYSHLAQWGMDTSPILRQLDAANTAVRQSEEEDKELEARRHEN